jgi:hypothetical protein
MKGATRIPSDMKAGTARGNRPALATPCHREADGRGLRERSWLNYAAQRNVTVRDKTMRHNGTLRDKTERQDDAWQDATQRCGTTKRDDTARN